MRGCVRGGCESASVDPTYMPLRLLSAIKLMICVEGMLLLLVGTKSTTSSVVCCLLGPSRLVVLNST